MEEWWSECLVRWQGKPHALIFFESGKGQQIVGGKINVSKVHIVASKCEWNKKWSWQVEAEILREGSVMRSGRKLCVGSITCGNGTLHEGSIMVEAGNYTREVQCGIVKPKWSKKVENSGGMHGGLHDWLEALVRTISYDKSQATASTAICTMPGFLWDENCHSCQGYFILNEGWYFIPCQGIFHICYILFQGIFHIHFILCQGIFHFCFIICQGIFHSLPGNISFLFHYLPGDISFLFHYLSGYISFCFILCQGKFKFLFHYLSEDISVFSRGYFASISFFVRGYFISISFSARGYFISVSFFARGYFFSVSFFAWE